MKEIEKEMREGAGQISEIYILGKPREAYI